MQFSCFCIRRYSNVCFFWNDISVSSTMKYPMTSRGKLNLFCDVASLYNHHHLLYPAKISKPARLTPTVLLRSWIVSRLRRAAASRSLNREIDPHLSSGYQKSSNKDPIYNKGRNIAFNALLLSRVPPKVKRKVEQNLTNPLQWLMRATRIITEVSISTTSPPFGRQP